MLYSSCVFHKVAGAGRCVLDGKTSAGRLVSVRPGDSILPNGCRFPLLWI